MRLIDADALKKAFESWKNVDDYYHDTDCGDIPFSEAYDLIDNAPTVFDCRACKHNGNERECADCYGDHSNFAEMHGGGE